MAIVTDRTNIDVYSIMACRDERSAKRALLKALETQYAEHGLSVEIMDAEELLEAIRTSNSEIDAAYGSKRNVVVIITPSERDLRKRIKKSADWREIPIETYRV